MNNLEEINKFLEKYKFIRQILRKVQSLKNESVRNRKYEQTNKQYEIEPVALQLPTNKRPAPRGGMGREMGGRLRERGHMYTYG